MHLFDRKAATRKAVVWHGAGDIRLDDVPEPRIQNLAAAIEAFEHFDKRDRGWIKTELRAAA